jgi:uncharacterized membrane protein
MRGSVIGLLVGVALGFAGVFGGFDAFIIVFVLGAVGFLVGLAIDRDVNVRDYFNGRGRR